MVASECDHLFLECVENTVKHVLLRQQGQICSLYLVCTHRLVKALCNEVFSLAENLKKALLVQTLFHWLLKFIVITKYFTFKGGFCFMQPFLNTCSALTHKANWLFIIWKRLWHLHALQILDACDNLCRLCVTGQLCLRFILLWCDYIKHAVAALLIIEANHAVFIFGSYFALTSNKWYTWSLEKARFSKAFEHACFATSASYNIFTINAMELVKWVRLGAGGERKVKGWRHS